MPHILALDQGTTSSRAIVFDEAGNIVSIAQQEFQQYYPHPAWVEHDPEEIWQSQLAVAQECCNEPGFSRPTSRPWASPISGKRLSFGIARRASQFTRPSSGKIAARLTCASGYGPQGARPW